MPRPVLLRQRRLAKSRVCSPSQPGQTFPRAGSDLPQSRVCSPSEPGQTFPRAGSNLPQSRVCSPSEPRLRSEKFTTQAFPCLIALVGHPRPKSTRDDVKHALPLLLPFCKRSWRVPPGRHPPCPDGRGLQAPGCRGPPGGGAGCRARLRPAPLRPAAPRSMAGFADLNLPQGPDKKSLQSLLEAAAHCESVPRARRERGEQRGRPEARVGGGAGARCGAEPSRAGGPELGRAGPGQEGSGTRAAAPPGWRGRSVSL